MCPCHCAPKEVVPVFALLYILLSLCEKIRQLILMLIEGKSLPGRFDTDRMCSVVESDEEKHRGHARR